MKLIVEFVRYIEPDPVPLPVAVVTSIETTEGVTSDEIDFASKDELVPLPVEKEYAVVPLLQVSLVASVRTFVRLSEQTVSEVRAIGAATATDDAIAAPAIKADIVFRFFI